MKISKKYSFFSLLIMIIALLSFLTIKTVDCKNVYADTTYTVKYDVNGGSAGYKIYPEYHDMSVGGIVDLTYSPTKTGCVFLGWNSDKNATSASKDENYVLQESDISNAVDGTITFYAIYQAQYGYTYSGSGWSSAAQTSYNKNDQITINNTYTNKGELAVFINLNGQSEYAVIYNTNPFTYTFNNSGGTVELNGTTVTIKDKYNIVYSVSDNTSGSAPSTDTLYSVGESISLDDGSSFSRTGYTFMGWSTVSTSSTGNNGDYTIVADDILDKVNSDTITFYAIWKENVLKDNTQSTISVSYNGQNYATVDLIDYCISISGFNGSSKKSDGTLYLKFKEADEYKVASSATSGVEAIEPGNYNVYYKYTLTNYNDIEGSFTLIISQKTITIDWSSDDYTYNGNVQELTASYKDISNNDISLTVTITQDDEVVDFKNAGTYVATVSFVSSDAHYKLPDNPTQEFIINQAEIEIDWGNLELEYTGSAQAPSPTIASLFGDDKCTITVSGEETNVGDNYTVTATSLSNDNYKLPDKSTSTFSIVRANPEVVVEASTNLRYDQTNKYLLKTATTSGGTLYFAYNKSSTTEPVGSYSTSLPYVTEAGTYYVWYYVDGDDNYNSTTVTNVEVVVIATYTVTYNGNGNTSGSVPTDSSRYALNEEITILGNPNSLIKTNYKFLGWASSSDATSPLDLTDDKYTLVTENNITFYAVWKKIISSDIDSSNGYKVTIDSSIDDNISYQWYKTVSSTYTSDFFKTSDVESYLSVDQEPDGSTITTASPWMIVPNYYISLTTVNCLAKSVVKFAYSGSSMLDCDATLVDDHYEIEFNGNEYKSIYFSELSQITITEFIVYSGEALQNETNAKLGSTTLEDTEYYCVITLESGDYAVSKKVCPNKVSFDKNSGIGDAPSDIYELEGRAVTYPSTSLTKTDYKFLGWNTSSSATTSLTEYTIGSTDTTLYAIWQKIIEIEPSKDNEYEVIVESSINDVSYQWQKGTYKWVDATLANLIMEELMIIDIIQIPIL